MLLSNDSYILAYLSKSSRIYVGHCGWGLYGDCTGTVRGLYGDCKFLAFRARALFWSFVRNGLGTAPIQTNMSKGVVYPELRL